MITTHYRIIIKVFLLGIIAFRSVAQEVTIDDLKATTAPAFNIIDVEPKSTSSPTTPKALATNLVSAFDANGLKPNVSIEAAPFWLGQKRNLTFDKYLNPDLSQSLWQTLGISIATKQLTGKNSNQQGTQLGVGIRSQLIPGKASSASKILISKTSSEALMAAVINTIIGTGLSDKVAIKSGIQSTIGRIRSGAIPVLTATMNSAEVINYFNDRTIDAEGDILKIIDKEDIKNGETVDNYLRRIKASNFLISATTLKLQESLKKRVGLIIEVSLAKALTFPTNTVEGVRSDKAGGWANITYRFDNQNHEITALARFTRAYQDSLISNQDYGIAYTHNIKDLSISLEAVLRNYQIEFNDKNSQGESIRRIEKDNTTRIALNFDYKLSDSVSLTATFGKNYKNEFFTTGNLLALLGINFGLPAKPIVPIK